MGGRIEREAKESISLAVLVERIVILAMTVLGPFLWHAKQPSQAQPSPTKRPPSSQHLVPGQWSRLAQKPTRVRQCGHSPTVFPPYPVRLLTGCEPDKASGSTLTINVGTVANSDGTDTFNVTTTRTIDLNTGGLWGLDTYPTTPTADGTAYYLHIVANPTTGDKGFLVSKYFDVAPPNQPPTIIIPSGYNYFRRFPFSFVYRTATGWGTSTGIPDFQLLSWPRSAVRYTGADYSGTYTALSVSQATNFTAVNLSSWCTNLTRQVVLMCEVRNDGVHGAGSAFIASQGGAANGLLVGSSSVNYQNMTYVTIQTNVDRSPVPFGTPQIFYKTTGGAQLSIYVIGYDFSDPS